MVEFTLHEVLVASISQVMTKSNGKGILMVNDVAEEIVNETLYGDSIRLQQVLADFLLISVNYAATGGQLNVAASLTKDQLGQSVHLARLELRISHSGGGVPEALLNQMFGTDGDPSEEGISLFISRKLLKLMNGDVRPKGFSKKNVVQSVYYCLRGIEGQSCISLAIFVGVCFMMNAIMIPT
ncbi:hypothetical protein CMV_027837 [Castanea mollissima]|uniref:Histidine kinase domain-containing protein n=1 Tax=Castanea mollissima TaxID=60419 RepID=A0A8J4Q8T2_9ROSI|nr:hypothetical protein CMV_027837 [Castanea mollissima]